ncbi:mammalian cell entry protein [Mycobacterium sp. CBMA 234]|uniref:MlaD family protein n=1 Tax=Mycolicibacterium sp. CBMA 234 TaxID=1918495 RepID=UPI0012DF7224|nr:MlaD family protein [Mycolicibacterium sp. CBMA 234]MUL64548.1 mammalian cell entry protein [Mycolicibacterium sp. CBMA 234]
MKFLRNPIIWGAGAVVFATVVAVALAHVYLNPPGQGKIVAFYTDDAASVRVGEEVRMAGITVGKVMDLSLEPNQVLVKARVNDDAFVGDQSQVDVRMLTVVGGYYVNVASIGATSLGARTIPRSHVTMPYSLVRALTDTTKITENVNPTSVNQSLDQIANGLTGTNVEVVSNVINAGNGLMSAVERQRGQVTKILDISDEYIRTLANYREKFAELLRKVSIVIQTLVIYNGGLAGTLQGLGEVLQDLIPIANFYDNHRLSFVEKVRNYLSKGQDFVTRNGVTIRALQRVQNLMDRVLDAQNAPPGLLATDLCMPLPGSAC